MRDGTTVGMYKYVAVELIEGHNLKGGVCIGYQYVHTYFVVVTPLSNGGEEIGRVIVVGSKRHTVSAQPNHLKTIGVLDASES